MASLSKSLFKRLFAARARRRAERGVVHQNHTARLFELAQRVNVARHPPRVQSEFGVPFHGVEDGCVAADVEHLKLPERW